MPRHNELIDLTMIVHRETDKAILASDSGDAADAVWLAKSQVEIMQDDAHPGIHTITIPTWIATEKGLI